MQYPATDQGISDFNHDWQQTYAVINDMSFLIEEAVSYRGGELTVSVREVNRKSVKSREIYISNGPMDITPETFSVPGSQMFEWERHLYYFSRNIVRQFKRGICSNNSSIRNVATEYPLEGINWDWCCAIAHVLDPVKYLTVEMICNLKLREGEGKAITSELGIAKMGNMLGLYFLGNEIGYVERGKVLLVSEWEFLTPKLLDHMEILDVI